MSIKVKKVSIAISVMLLSLTSTVAAQLVGATESGDVTAPTLYSPENGVFLRDGTPTFEWTLGENTENSWLIIDNDPDFVSPIVNRCIARPENTYTIPLENSLSTGKYYWKVIAENQEATGIRTMESGVRNFTVMMDPITFGIDLALIGISCTFGALTIIIGVCILMKKVAKRRLVVPEAKPSTEEGGPKQPSGSEQ